MELVWKHLKADTVGRSRNSELRGLQRESEIIDAFLAARHQKNPLFLRKRHAQIHRPECLITYVLINNMERRSPRTALNRVLDSASLLESGSSTVANWSVMSPHHLRRVPPSSAAVRHSRKFRQRRSSAATKLSSTRFLSQRAAREPSKAGHEGSGLHRSHLTSHPSSRETSSGRRGWQLSPHRDALSD